MSALRVLVADDELLARRRLVRLLGELPGVDIAGEAQDGVEVLRAIADGEIDVVLLDIQMPGLSGVEAMKLWPANGPAIVFTTAHSEHAVAAFEGGAVDYLLKPVEAERLGKTLDRVRERRTAAPPADGLPRRLGVPTRKGVVLLAPSEIIACVLEGETTTLHTDRGVLFSDLRLADLERRLGSGFERVHRKALVNLARIERLEPVDSGGYIAHLQGGPPVPVSRQVARRYRREWDIP